MPAPKRPRRERTHDWEKIKQWTLWPEQELYEQESLPITAYNGSLSTGLLPHSKPGVTSPGR